MTTELITATVKVLVLLALVIPLIMSLNMLHKFKVQYERPILKIHLGKYAIRPCRKIEGDAYDISANLMLLREYLKDIENYRELYFKGAILTETECIIQPNARVLIPTGITVSFNKAWKLNVRPRSGLAIKAGLTLLNSPGLVDCTYRGDVGVIIHNVNDKPVSIEYNDRIGQIEMVRNENIRFIEVNSKDDLDDIDRGGGFGHSGDGIINTVEQSVENTTNIIIKEGLNTVQKFILNMIAYRK